MFAGASRSSINMTVKWDGAPAYLLEYDPADRSIFRCKEIRVQVRPKVI